MTAAAVSPALLAALRERIGPLGTERIDQVWIFGPRQVGTAESSLAVVSLRSADDPDRRDVLTLHCSATTERGRTRRVDQLVEQGAAPAARVERLIRGVLHRLRDDSDLVRTETIAGSNERWLALTEPADHPA